MPSHGFLSYDNVISPVWLSPPFYRWVKWLDQGHKLVCGRLSAKSMHACLLICFGRVQFFVTPLTVALGAPLSMGFTRQEYWSGLPCPPAGNLPDPGIWPTSLMSSAMSGRFFTTSTTWGEPLKYPRPALKPMLSTNYCTDYPLRSILGIPCEIRAYFHRHVSWQHLGNFHTITGILTVFVKFKGTSAFTVFHCSYWECLSFSSNPLFMSI